MKKRLPRKLKKAIKKIVHYYDGCFLAKCDSGRFTKYMRKAIMYHDGYYERYWGDKDFKETRRGKLIDELLPNVCRITHCYPFWKPTAKWHKKNGHIFVYYKDGYNFPNGKWVPKERPKDMYHRTLRCKDREYYVQRESYDYLKGYQVVESYRITEEEWKDENIKTKELFKIYQEKYVSTCN